MFSTNVKRSLLPVGVIALAIAGPASAGTALEAPGDQPSSQAHSPAPPKLSTGGHPSQGAPTVGGGTTTKPERYRSPTAGLAG